MQFDTIKSCLPSPRRSRGETLTRFRDLLGCHFIVLRANAVGPGSLNETLQFVVGQDSDHIATRFLHRRGYRDGATSDGVGLRYTATVV